MLRLEASERVPLRGIELPAILTFPLSPFLRGFTFNKLCSVSQIPSYQNSMLLSTNIRDQDRETGWLSLDKELIYLKDNQEEELGVAGRR